MTLAGQALTASNAMGGNFTLGIGLSHEPMMAQLGLAFEKPIRHLREYLSILMPLLHSGAVTFDGELLSCTGQFFQPPERPVPVLVAALGPQALGVAGRLADGTTLAWVGPKTVKEHIVPRISESAAASGRQRPRILATLPVCVTDQPEVLRQSIGRGLSMYGKLPSYQAMFQREGVHGPADLAIVGSAEQVKEEIAGLAEAGVTSFAASEYCLTPQERTDTRQTLVKLIGEV
jgi:F420-dependent oxidoreductase-like protein